MCLSRYRGFVNPTEYREAPVPSALGKWWSAPPREKVVKIQDGALLLTTGGVFIVVHRTISIVPQMVGCLEGVQKRLEGY